MKIRDLVTTDAQLLTNLHQRIFPKSWTESEFKTLLENHVVCGFLAVDKEKPVGFILAQVAMDQADILTFCVLPEFQGLGVGQTLLLTLETFLHHQKVQEIILEVAHNNFSALHLYHKQNYIPVAVRKDYYQESPGIQRDAIVMIKKLSPALS